MCGQLANNAPRAPLLDHYTLLEPVQLIERLMARMQQPPTHVRPFRVASVDGTDHGESKHYTHSGQRSILWCRRGNLSAPTAEYFCPAFLSRFYHSPETILGTHYQRTTACTGETRTQHSHGTLLISPASVQHYADVCRVLSAGHALGVPPIATLGAPEILGTLLRASGGLFTT